MKKSYNSPNSKYISLIGESLLLTASDPQIGRGEGAVEETRKQDFINTPWDNWSE